MLASWKKTKRKTCWCWICAKVNPDFLPILNYVYLIITFNNYRFSKVTHRRNIERRKEKFGWVFSEKYSIESIFLWVFSDKYCMESKFEWASSGKYSMESRFGGAFFDEYYRKSKFGWAFSHIHSLESKFGWAFSDKHSM